MARGRFRSRFVLSAALFLPFFSSHAAGAALKLQISNGHPVLNQVYINGSGPYRFLLDTGTTLNHIDPLIAKAAGLTPTFRTELRSSTGSTVVTGAQGINIDLPGAVDADDQTFLFGGIEAVRRWLPDVAGVLGQDFLSRFDYLLDLHAGTIEFSPQTPPDAADRTPLQVIDGRPAVATNLGPLVVDSGASQVTLFNVRPSTINRDMVSELVTMTGSMRVGTIFRKLSIAGRPLWNGDALAIPHSAETSAAGLLPTNLFRTVYVSNSGGYVALDRK